MTCFVHAGEPFNEEEVEEMMSAALGEEQRIMYKDYVPLMAVEENLTVWTYVTGVKTVIW